MQTIDGSQHLPDLIRFGFSALVFLNVHPRIAGPGGTVNVMATDLARWTEKVVADLHQVVETDVTWILPHPDQDFVNGCHNAEF